MEFVRLFATTSFLISMRVDWEDGLFPFNFTRLTHLAFVAYLWHPDEALGSYAVFFEIVVGLLYWPFFSGAWRSSLQDVEKFTSLSSHLLLPLTAAWLVYKKPYKAPDFGRVVGILALYAVLVNAASVARIAPKNPYPNLTDYAGRDKAFKNFSKTLALLGFLWLAREVLGLLAK
jgi:hypothetical protein